MLGALIAANGFILVNGGGGQGVMGAMNEGCRAKGGHVRGVIHEMFCVDIVHDSKISDMIICKGNDLKERKQMLLDNGDCLIVMPGFSFFFFLHFFFFAFFFFWMFDKTNNSKESKD